MKPLYKVWVKIPSDCNINLQGKLLKKCDGQTDRYG